MDSFNRRNFIDRGGKGLILASGFPFLIKPSDHNLWNDQAGNSEISPRFPSQDIESVREVVGASHTRFERVRELVDARPGLAKAVYDWGFGDWESALGAASHMGRRDIAEYLIHHGARPNIYTYAMFGELAAVKHMVEAIPGIQRINGPHGITLLQHAKNRLRRDTIGATERTNVEDVVRYLESLGDADQRDLNLPIREEEKEQYMGKYVFGDGPEDYFEVKLNQRGGLFMSRSEQVGRVLLRVEEHAFAPGGAPAVRIRFETNGDRVVSLTIHDPEPLVKAIRKDA